MTYIFYMLIPIGCFACIFILNISFMFVSMYNIMIKKKNKFF
jgi:hypothetical protein